MPQTEVPADIYQPSTEEAERRSARRAPECPGGDRAMSLGIAREDRPDLSIKQGDVMWACTAEQVIYPAPLLPAVLAELLFPDDWSLLPPG